jgi:hypothetical protein
VAGDLQLGREVARCSSGPCDRPCDKHRNSPNLGGNMVEAAGVACHYICAPWRSDRGIPRTSPGRWCPERCGAQRNAARCSGTAACVVDPVAVELEAALAPCALRLAPGRCRCEGSAPSAAPDRRSC